MFLPLCLVTWVADSAHAQGRGRAHTVKAGQSLWEIARTHGCAVREIQEANDIDGKVILPGQTLRIPRCISGAGGVIVHTVAPGDTLYELARSYDTSVEDVRRRNGLSGNMIKPGQSLRIVVGKDGQGRPIKGQSVGRAHNGRLVNGMQLPRGRGYYRRRPHRAWAANHTVFQVRRAIMAVRARFPGIHDLAIGDLSSRDGGPLPGHRSHQSGRDVDLGLYYRKRPKGYPKSFIAPSASNLDLPATWVLVETLAATASSPAGVEYMFLNYDLQKRLYKWAEKEGVSKRKLRRIFQYPRGEYSASGIIRHEPGHNAHIHVRFKCPKNDKACR